jgi:arylsulfatase A-like enzyme
VSGPNIIYVVCHDLGKHLGCYGLEGLPTPNLDRLASEGATFERMMCSSTACSPSRGCAMTGQYAHTNGLMGLVNGGWSMPESTLTIVDHLNALGYETVHIGFQHERWIANANRYAIERYEVFDDIFCEAGVTQAITYLEQRDRGGRPFYLNIGTAEVHGSIWDRLPGVDPADVVLPWVVPDKPDLRVGWARFQAALAHMDEQLGRLFDAIDRLGHREDTLLVFTTDHGLPGTRGKGQLYIHGVEISLIMRLPGRIPEGLRVPDLLGNVDVVPTLLEACGAPPAPLVQGRSFWSAATARPEPRRQEIFLERNYHAGAPGYHLSPAGLDPRTAPRPAVGQAAVKPAAAPPVPHPPSMGWAGYDPMRSVRTDEYTYIRNDADHPQRDWLPDEVSDRWEEAGHVYPPQSEPRGREELFAVVDDPHETRNLAHDPAYASVLADLAARVDRWMTETADPLLEGPIPNMLHAWPD